MKLSKTLLQAMVVAVAAGAITSCKKPVSDLKKPTEKTEKKSTSEVNPEGCPACGMG